MTRRAPDAPRPAFTRATYARQLLSFVAEVGEATFASLSGRRPELGLEPIYARYASLFDDTAIDALRGLAAGETEDARQARALLGFAVEGNLARRVAALTDAIQLAEATAVIVWRGERLGYRATPFRIASTSDRTERNAIQASYDRAVDAINPLREERFGTMRSAIEELGFGSEVGLVRELHDIDVDALAADLRQFLVESETVHYAALRRYLAEIDIEQGDASAADLAHLLRGSGWDAWFEPRRLMPVLESTLAGLGIDLRAQENLTLDFEARRNKSPRAIAVPVRMPGDIRLVIQSRGGHYDYEAALHQIGHAEHFAHADPKLPAAWKHAGDASVTEAYAFLLQHLAVDPGWLSEQLGMADADLAGWMDFAAFRELVALRRSTARLLYEQRLHADGDLPLARSYYSGLLGLLVGVRIPEAGYLADRDDHLYVSRYLRAWMLEASLAASLRERHGREWWREPAAGETLKRSWSRGGEWNADALLAHLGYDRLDWRPVLRQIRTRLIGEMSGYGGPNITTRAGTRKV